MNAVAPRATTSKPGSLPVPGTTVQCPADRGDPAFTARIVHVGEQRCNHMGGPEFVWVTVRKLNGMSGGVWPSHRLGYVL